MRKSESTENQIIAVVISVEVGLTLIVVCRVCSITSTKQMHVINIQDTN
ncbi:MAG: hypothetical protein XXXJIFNMEKO3_01906 [Candidatus Erwinia impunctatus]|nr:hypothetical protein XXXJIFNMEKO_01906 [Culicoides impunctatus]